VATLSVLVRFLHQTPTAVSLAQQIRTSIAAPVIVSQSICSTGRLSVRPLLRLFNLPLHHPLLPKSAQSVELAQLALRAYRRLLALLFHFCHLDGMPMAVGSTVCQLVEPWFMNWIWPTTQSRIVLHTASWVVIQSQDWSTGTSWSTALK